MNFYPSHIATVVIRRWGMVFALLMLCGNIHAQTNSPDRWLLVFDASSTMKTRLAGTETALKQFLATSAGGEIRGGDSMAIWTYDKLPHGGPNSFEWRTDGIVELTTNLTSFLQRQSYLTISSLPALQGPLARVVSGSERLTIVIFCDGQSRINFTPYDEGINQYFSDSLAERKKNRQPFVVVLRSQHGKYIGCTVNFPPAGISLPPFPPLPAPPQPNPPPVRPAPVAVPAIAPSLVIIGTKVGTNLEAKAELLPTTNNLPVVPTNPVPSVVKPTPSNPPVTPAPVKVEPPPVLPATNLTKSASALPKTNPPLTTVVVTQVVAKTIAPVAPTNPPAPAVAASEGEKSNRTGMVFLIAGVLLAAVLIVAGMVIRAGRRPQSSLISSSMEDDSHRK